MRPDTASDDLLDRLAGEYVLGTLRGGARRRFTRWLADNAALAARCRAWEGRLSGLAAGVAPVTPPPRLLVAIRARLQAARPAPGWWQWAAGFAVAALLGALLAYQQGGLARPDEVALFTGPAGSVQWRVEVYRDQRLVMRAPQPAAKAGDRDFELWALPGGDAPAVSLGVMPVRGDAALRLSRAQAVALRTARQLAVSLEPLGGSPTGHATGPVVFVAALRTAG